jgi:hypothetical protein
MPFGHASAFSQEEKRKNAPPLNTPADRKSVFSKKILLAGKGKRTMEK